MDSDLQDLIVKSQNGDRAAFAAVIGASARGVYARVVLQTKDRGKAEDLVQETFIRAWKALPELREVTGFHAWLAAIAHRTVIDAARREAAQKRSVTGFSTGRTQDLVSPLEAAGAAEERDRLLACLRELPEMYRIPLMLRFVDGADHDTICRQLNVTPGALRGQLYRGLAMLRERFLGSAERQEKDNG